MKKIVLVFCLLILIFFLHGNPDKIGLALSGGGARGFVHIGLLKVIDEVGLEVDYIAGTSFGALVGSLYSLGYSGKEIEDMFLNEDYTSIFSDKIERGDLYIEDKRWFDYGNVSLEIDKNMNVSIPLSIISGNNIVLILSKYLARSMYYNDFDSYPIPFRCVATNLENGQSVEFTDGDLISAVRASMAFPSVLEPFEVDGELYVDGGVKANLPVDTALSMGADYIIANKASSPLRAKEDCDNLLAVLDQTININMSLWVNEALKKSDLVIEPDLKGYTASSFDEIEELINIGESAARAHIDELIQLAENRSYSERTSKKIYKVPNKIRLNKIITFSSDQLSGYKIKLLTGLVEGEPYSLDEIVTGVKECYNSGLFVWAYPRLSYTDGVYILEVVTKEKAKGYLDVDLVYTDSEDLVFGVTTTLNNVIQKNSKLIANVKFGGRTSFVIDYVKNFGELYGGYYRLFPFIEKKKLYNYNIDDEIINRVESRELGGNIGVGFFIKDLLVGEGYIYSQRNRLSQDISDVDFERDMFKSTGLGFKLYHESVDDMYFPTKGTMFAFKYKHSFEEFLSDESFDKFQGVAKLAIPLHDRFSLSYHVEGGSFQNETYAKQFIPFEIGGVDSFSDIDKSSSKFSSYAFSDISATYNIDKTYFITGSVHHLVQSNDNDFDDFEKEDSAYCLEFGYQSPIGPVRLGSVADEDFDISTYFSFGYTLDMFMLSGN